MSKKIILVGDIHFRDKKLSDIAEAWSRLVAYAHKAKIDLITCAGDVFDHVNVAGKEKTVGTIYNAFMAPFMDRKERVPLVLIYGNHDIGPALEKDALSPLEGCPWITIIRRPGVHKVLDGVSICALPWISREAVATRLVASKGIGNKEAEQQADASIESLPDRLRSEVKEKVNGEFVLFLGHLEVTGAALNNGQVQANGTFEFDPSTLASIGASAYGLGHIHGRQPIPGLPQANDGYLGTLCQLSFGEEGHWSGCRLLEIEGQAVVSDTWLENKTSPKYLTVDSLEDLSRRDNDYVKLRCEDRPEVLPDGVIFEKVVVNRDRRAIDDQLSADAPMRTLLEAWSKNSKCEVSIERLCEGEESLRSELGAYGEAMGSLDSIDSITLDNITCHDRLEINLPLGITAIEGPNGSGKTTVVESPLVALYGKSPTRAVASLVSQGKSDGRVEVAFHSGGKRYVAIREIKVTPKSSSTKAFLMDEDGGVIAGPKVEEVEAKCAALVGDVRMVMAGIFSSQEDASQKGNMACGLVDVGAAERKELFAKLLGTHRLIEMSVLAKRRAQAAEAAVQGSEEMIKRLQEGLSSEEEDAAELGKAKEEERRAKGDVEKVKSSLESAKERLADIEASNRERAGAIEENSRLEAERDEITTNARKLKEKRDALQGIDPSELAGRVNKARKAETELAKMEAEVEKYNALRQSRLSEIEKIRANADRMENARRLAHAEAVSAAMSRVEEHRRERVLGRKKLEDMRQDTVVKMEKLKGRLAEARRKVELLEGFPDADICQTCSFAKDGLESRSKIEDFERAIPRGEAILTQADEQISSYDAETEKASEALARTPGLEDWQPEVVKEIDAARAEADKKEAAIPSPPEGLADAMEELRKACAGLSDMEAELAKAEKASDEAASITSEISELKGKFEELGRRIDGIKIPDKIDDSTSIALVKTIVEEVERKSNELSEATKLVGQWEARVESNAKKREQISEISEKRKEHEQRGEVMSALFGAFGRDGIPQLVVDGVLPRFQEIMASLLSEFGKGWAIQVKSQRATKSGTVQEAIDILIDSGLGERDISTYSGGEKKILKGIVRVAFATLQAERTGKGLKVLVMDEATDHMDDENAETTVRMLRTLKCFNQVILISHHTRVLGEIVHRIRLGTKSSIEQIKKERM